MQTAFSKLLRRISENVPRLISLHQTPPNVIPKAFMGKAIKDPVRIGNAQGFWGDRLSAAATLLHQQPDLHYLTLDYLSEVSMSIMAIQKKKSPQEGYAKDFLQTLQTVLEPWQQGSQVKIITNAGGLNPLACGQACRQLLDEAGMQSKKIGIVDGDNVLSLMQKHGSDKLFNNLDSGESLDRVKKHLMTANAYLGAAPILELLRAGADIVITGRVADPSLTVAPAAAYHHWSLEDYDVFAQATVAGHLLECGTQVTGGVTTDWLNHFVSVQEAAQEAFPVAEIFSDGSFIITKPPQGKGRVDLQTVKEQLLYEIGNPAAYLSPDVTASFLGLQLKEVGKDRVHISGAQGKPPTTTYKVSATYADGYKAEAMLAIFGPEAKKKAQLCGQIILQRVAEAGHPLQRSLIECLGTGDLVGGIVPHVQDNALECVLRIAVADSRRERLECFIREIAPLITSGPQGITGYTSGKPHIREVFGYWPCLINRSSVHPRIQML